jgi:hypothetical protein
LRAVARRNSGIASSRRPKAENPGTVGGSLGREGFIDE